MDTLLSRFFRNNTIDAPIQQIAVQHKSIPRANRIVARLLELDDALDKETQDRIRQALEWHHLQGDALLEHVAGNRVVTYLHGDELHLTAYKHVWSVRYVENLLDAESTVWQVEHFDRSAIAVAFTALLQRYHSKNPLQATNLGRGDQ